MWFIKFSNSFPLLSSSMTFISAFLLIILCLVASELSFLIVNLRGWKLVLLQLKIKGGPLLLTTKGLTLLALMMTWCILVRKYLFFRSSLFFWLGYSHLKFILYFYFRWTTSWYKPRSQPRTVFV